MCVDLRYNEKAFIKFLNNLYDKPGEGMEGIIKNQAYYAKMLYIEECNISGKRWCPKTAKDIFEYEYKNMIRWVNDTKKKEKKVKHEFSIEGKKHDQEIRDEFKQWFLKEKKNLMNDDKVQNIEDLIDKDDEYQDYVKTNEIIIQENNTNIDNLDDEKQKRLDTAINKRKQLENKQCHNEWVNNPITTKWINNKKY